MDEYGAVANGRGCVYDIAVVEMIQPAKQGRMAQLMNRIETLPAFPFYSDLTDDPTQWPPRAHRDRQDFVNLVIGFLSQARVRELVARWEAGSQDLKLELLGNNGTSEHTALAQSYMRLRMFYADHPDAFRAAFDRDFQEGFVKLERARDQLAGTYPNRLMILRVENRGSQDVKNFRAEIDAAGPVYDVVLNEEEGQAKSMPWSPAHKVIEIETLRPADQAEIRVWYTRASLDPLFSGPTDLVWEKAQGIRVRNIAVSNGRLSRNKSLLANVEAYTRFPVDPATLP
jgi:hypothetical protein